MIEFWPKAKLVTEIAPAKCIVCGKKNPLGESTEQGTPIGGGWCYLAGSIPVGSIACSPECTRIAVDRFRQTGRCDTKGLS